MAPEVYEGSLELLVSSSSFADRDSRASRHGKAIGGLEATPERRGRVVLRHRRDPLRAESCAIDREEWLTDRQDDLGKILGEYRERGERSCRTVAAIDLEVAWDIFLASLSDKKGG